MKKAMGQWLLATLLGILLAACAIFYAKYTSRTDGPKPGIDAQTDIAYIQSALKTAESSSHPQTQIKYYRLAYETAMQLENHWPDSDQVPDFLERYSNSLNSIPEKVYRLSLQARDLDSLKWAASFTPKVDLDQDAFRQIWKMGKPWRDYFISEYPEESLSIFMMEAVRDRNVSFFNQYIDRFIASGYTLPSPQAATDFNDRLCSFVAEMIEVAIEQEDLERVKYLLDHLPPFNSVVIIDPKTKQIMQSLGDYVCYELKDEALACRLVGLGYEMNRIDVDKTGFGRDFAEALMADLEHAVKHVLRLNEWYVALSTKEARFVLILPDPILRAVHPQHLIEAAEYTMKSKTRNSTSDTFRLIKIRAEIQPLTIPEYGRLLDAAIEHKNRIVEARLKTQVDQLNVYTIDLAELAESPTLFQLYAPKIMKKIYKSMDKNPRPDGTTLGRIDDLLSSHNPEAALYVVKKYDFDDDWSDLSADDRTVLMAVCEGGNLDAAKHLIENKRADLHAHTSFFESEITLLGRAKDVEGKYRPIHFAAKSGNSELIRYLKTEGADINAQSGFGVTPLMMAVSENHLEAAKSLIDLGANINATMKSDLSPSCLADIGGYENGLTAYRRARRNGNQEMIAMLEKAGAKPE